MLLPIDALHATAGCRQNERPRRRRAAGFRRMSSTRASVVAVSRCERERETFVIMLDPDFDVTAIASAAAPVTCTPAAVVCAGRGIAADGVPALGETEMRTLLGRWPAAGMVLVDAPAPTLAHFPNALLASWADPFSVPLAVNRILDRAAPRSFAGSVARVLQAADAALRPDLEAAQALAALADCARRPESSEVALRFFGETLVALLDRLAWVDWFDASADLDAASARDEIEELFAALRLALDERGLRAQCRGVEFIWDARERAPVPPTSTRARVLARCLRQLLLRLPSGRVAIERRGERLSIRHAARQAQAAEEFEVIALANLLRRIHLQLRIAATELSVAPEPSHEWLSA